MRGLWGSSVLLAWGGLALFQSSALLGQVASQLNCDAVVDTTGLRGAVLLITAVGLVLIPVAIEQVSIDGPPSVSLPLISLVASLLSIISVVLLALLLAVPPPDIDMADLVLAYLLPAAPFAVALVASILAITLRRASVRARSIWVALASFVGSTAIALIYGVATVQRCGSMPVLASTGIGAPDAVRWGGLTGSALVVAAICGCLLLASRRRVLLRRNATILICSILIIGALLTILGFARG